MYVEGERGACSPGLSQPMTVSETLQMPLLVPVLHPFLRSNDISVSNLQSPGRFAVAGGQSGLPKQSPFQCVDSQLNENPAVYIDRRTRKTLKIPSVHRT